MKAMKNLMLACLLLFSIYSSKGEDKLVVHEWGTFTSLQDEDGNAIGGINTDDEPVPPFVHRLAYYLLLPPSGNGSAGAVAGFSVAGKGITPKCHPDVTMRLETPVLYFYPPAGWRSRPVDVQVDFHGGWLSEYYPDAIFKIPGFDSAHPDRVYSNQSGSQAFSGFGHIKRDTVGELSWKGVTIGTDGTGPETQEKVWLAPRDVKAAMVKTSKGECEKFLFYRGVGNTDAPLRIVRDTKAHVLSVMDHHEAVNMINADQYLSIHAAWLVQVREDGSCAFKTTGKLEWPEHTILPDTFNPQDFSPDNLAHLKEEMRNALVNEGGLTTDEAGALLKTWETSYFKSPGLRFFYLCPDADVNSVLPLKISVPSAVTRVMIGRIEIVTPEQRALLEKISADPQPGDYAKLGRFRNALILDEQKHHPKKALGDFIQKNSLDAYKVE